MPELLPAPTTLPMHVEPQADEALVSWLVQLSYRLGQSPLMFSRHGLMVDAASEPGWWRRPSPDRLNLVAQRTGIDLERLAAMTFIGWTLARDEENAQRLARKRGRHQIPGYSRKYRFAVCGQCLAEDERPYLRLLWIQGWTGVCPRHRSVLTWECPACRHPFRLRGLETREPIDPLACAGCGGSFASRSSLAAHSDVLDLQARMVAGKRTGTVMLPDIEAMSWETTMAIADVLVEMIWSSKSDACAVVFNRVSRELGLDIQSRQLLSRGLNYSSLVMLAWLLGDQHPALAPHRKVAGTPRGYRRRYG